jgi:hypothetical protein
MPRCGSRWREGYVRLGRLCGRARERESMSAAASTPARRGRHYLARLVGAYLRRALGARPGLTLKARAVDVADEPLGRHKVRGGCLQGAKSEPSSIGVSRDRLCERTVIHALAGRQTCRVRSGGLSVLLGTGHADRSAARAVHRELSVIRAQGAAHGHLRGRRPALSANRPFRGARPRAARCAHML